MSTNGNGKNRRRHTDTLGYVLGLALLMAAVVLLWIENSRVDAQRDTNSAQEQKISLAHDQLISGCQRLNQLNARFNTSEYADYKVYTVVYAESVANEKRQTLTPQQHRDENAFLTPIKASISVKSWVPLTPCRLVINSVGSTYKLPNPVRFADRLPPKIYLERTLKPRTNDHSNPSITAKSSG